MRDMAVTDLPEPDSPTRARVSPLATLKLMLRTAWTVFSWSWKRMSRFSTVSNGVFMGVSSWCVSAVFGVECVAQAVADEVEAEEGGDEEEAGDEELPRGGFHGGCAVLEHGAPTGHGFLYAQSEEAEEGFEHDHAGDEQGGVNHDDAEYVGDDVAGNDAAAGYACDAGGFDEFFVSEAEGLAADDAGDVKP